MAEFLEILKYTIPAIIVFISVYIVLKNHQGQEKAKENLTIISGNQKIITPLRLQAYERLMLLLERISPDALVRRLQQPNMTAGQLQMSMLNTIRSEFDHNLSQQIYISSQAWGTLKHAKENLIRIINITGAKVKKDADATEFSVALFENISNEETDRLAAAGELLKKEIRVFFDM